jgi:ribosome biogenesis protein MAK21
LALHSIKHFLDRFIYRNPKSKNLMRGTSIMQPLPGPNASLVLNVRGNAQTEVAVNSEDWWRQQAEKIHPEVVFFHRYFVAKEQDEVRRAGKKRKRGDEEGSDLNEDEIFEALVKSSKEEGGFGDEEVDVDGTDEEIDRSEEDMDQSEDLDEDLDEEALEAMDIEMSDPEISGEEDGLDEDIEEENVSEEEGDIDAFFDDGAEEVDDENENEEEEEEEWQGVSDEDAEYSDSASESEGGENIGRFDFGDDESDIVGSDEDVPVVSSGHGESTKADRSKKRKLKNLPTFASVEEYAHLLED